jgi:biopolymer transport protein ExbD
VITRPLDLASKLRPEPRSFDFLFYVNAGLIVLFFDLLGSRFVLAPGLGVDFQIPKEKAALAGATATDRFISVLPSGQIFADGLMNMSQLKEWLKVEAKKLRQPSLLVRAHGGVPVSQLTEIVSAAHDAGFSVTLAAEEPPVEKSGTVSR